jgi:quercetin dioxygenase-like cupin family protein
VLQFRAMRRFLLLCLLTLPLLAAQTEVEITSEPSHHLVFENEYVRAFRVEIPPNHSTLLHWHRHDYIFSMLAAAHISNEVQGKPPVDPQFGDGETRFVAGNFAHIVKDLGDQSFRNVTIELLQDEKGRQAVSRWPEDSGEKTFPGGRSKTLFVKDGVRVSDVTLDSGAVAPSHHHDGPYLLVALSDLDLRSDVEGVGPVPEKLQAGDVKWMKGNQTHTVTNISRQGAHLVTLEF